MEGCRSGTSRRSPPKDGFTDLVLSWSFEEILDTNLYRNQVEKIPDTFQCVDKYLGSFVFALLEESRAELASALETVYKAPFAEVASLTELIVDNNYDVKVEYWRNRTAGRCKEPYRTLPGDIILLSDLKPEAADDLQRDGWSHAFAYVTNIEEDENGDYFTSTNFQVKTAMNFNGGDAQSKSFYVVFLMNMITNKRIWNALNMRKNLNIIEKVLCSNELGKENCEFCPLKCHSLMEINSGSTLLSKLNESQNEAVFSSLHKIECDHKASVELIWGPPGTGKTRTLSVLLYYLLKRNVRTLICAPTNVAITELASRVINLWRDSFTDECEQFLSCPLGDMLIFGHKDRLKVGSNIEEIFVDYRVDRLVECLLPQTGLNHWITSMLDFLEDCVSQHCIYIDNELTKGEGIHHEEIQQSKFKSLLEYARDRFTHIVPPLRRSILTFFTHLPRSCNLGTNFQNTLKLMSLLGSIEKLLFEDNLTSEELEIIFSHREMIGPESFIGTSSLVCMRLQCLSTLRSLQSSLAKLGLPLVKNRTSIMEFCFQKASLIFCTISSSYKLHSVNMEPLHLLVIDEAAQVKESESIIALQIPGVMHAILVGDECQLPATVNSKLSEEAGFCKSLFERLSSRGHSKHLLKMQYRMHPSISQFPNSNFYGSQILDAPSVQSDGYQRCYLQGRMFGPYSFINIFGGKEEVDDVGHSRRNMVEVAVTVKLVQKLFKAWNGSKEKLSIGVISPYDAQVVAIQDKLNQKYENLENFIVKVKSVDGFQGGEADIIIISTVRSNRGGSIGFLSSPQRTNVALTRARHCLWILGNERTLSESDTVWEELICNAKYRRCLFTADDDCDIAKTIITAKKELQQLEDLLHGESVLFKYARWKVLFSDNFRKSFGKLKPSHVKKLVINVLLKLASGWRPKKINVDLTCESSSYIVKQFKVEGYYVVCSIDIIKDSIWEQVLKVWDVLPLVEIPKLLKRLDGIFAMFTEDFVNRCNKKLLEGNLEMPYNWSSSDDVVRFKNLHYTKFSIDSGACSVDCRSFVENSKVSESLLLLKFYSLSTGSVNYLFSDHEGRESDLPFEVTDEEREIIIFPRSSFILGRSGTGKTTVLTMKLYRMLEQYCIASGESKPAENEMCSSKRFEKGSILHQLFVTVSPKLCYAVKHHVSQLKSFASRSLSANSSFEDMDDIEEMAEFKDIPDTFVGIEPEKYPLIITFHKFLMMLDGTLGNSYFEKFHYVRDSSQYEGRSFRSVALKTFMRKNEVTYDRFSFLYWPHFNSKLTKNLDPSRVFTEMMSHIKGGLQAGEACDTKRSRQDYVSLSDSRVSTLSADQREVIYDIYQDYEKMKMERREFDLADLVIDIHCRLKNENLLGDKMDFVYIDEVQDLNMRQIALFRHICKNVEEGFVFSGDTAQTIARGIDFRFEDIRSLFYNEFVKKSENYRSTGRREKGHVSDIFSLCQNFRTHTGVLRLAQSVIDLLCHFFPLSVDALAPETSFICGESPVVLEPGSDDSSIVTIFGCSGKSCGKWVGFGAEQVILVRDDTARNEISRYIGHQALILTIVECKGLEFQDVLLYNFFGSSPLSNQWRVVYEYLKEKDLFDTNFPKSFPSFNQSRHNILCSELKQLYVAITRTRQRLWICENIEEFSKPMFDYWQRLCLVQVRKVDDSLAEAMQRASSPEEWKSQGIKLFWEKNYEMATMCFERAGEPTWEKRAKASGLRAAADRLRGSNSMEARIMLREAAEIFDSIGRANSAAECFCELEEYKRAGMIYLHKCGVMELRKAAECFTLAGCYDIAAEVYAKGNFFTECLSACTKGKLFDMGLQYIEFWKQQAPSTSQNMTDLKEIEKIGQEFLQSCAFECYRTKNNLSFMKFVRAFHTMESKRNFLKSLDCLEELLILEEESGNFMEAAEVAKLMGDILLEVNLLGKAKNFANASRLILSYVLSNSIWMSASQGWPLKSFPQKEELLSKSLSFAEKVSASFHASVCTEVKILSHERRKLFELMQSYIAAKQSKNCRGEILSLRKLLDAHFQIHPAEFKWEHELPIDLKGYSEDKILKNQVSVRTLVYIWSLFNENSLEILECLGSLEKEDFSKLKGTAEFCFHYFGVRLQNSSLTCLLLNPDAKWVENVDKSFMHWNRKVATLHARHFVSAARKYWRRELLSIGLRVLEALRALYNYSVVKSLSKYCQSTCLTCIFHITKLFIESNSLEVKKADAWRWQEFLQLSTKCYFETVFPLDCQSLSENMISLRETELSKNLLEEVISRTISTEDGLTYGQIGRVVMIWLGSGKPKHDLYERMAKSFPKDSYWKAFIEILSGIMKPDSPMGSDTSNLVEKQRVSGDPQVLPVTSFGNGINQSGCLCESSSGCSNESLSHTLYKALEETYKANWRVKDYISPNCFLYLLERLLFLGSQPQGLFFTTKSSFVEWLICQQSDANPSSSLVADKQSSATCIFNFVVPVVMQFLYKIDDTREWIRNSGIHFKYYSVLILRFIVILCLVSLNSQMPFDILFKPLAVSQIRSQLPKEFYEALGRVKRNSNFYVGAVSRAFRAIGDPLVIVTLRKDPKFVCQDAIFLDLRCFSCKKDIMNVLFERRTGISYGHGTSVEGNVAKFSVGLPPINDNQGENTTIRSSEMMSKTDSNLSQENFKTNQQINWRFLGDISNMLGSQRNKNDGTLKTLGLKNKTQVEEHTNFLAAAVSRLTEQKSPLSVADEKVLYETTNVIEELKRLSSLLDMSDLDGMNFSAIGELLKNLELRRPQLDNTLTNLFLVQNKSDVSTVCSGLIDEKISFSKQETHNGNLEDLVVDVNKPINEVPECSRGKGKKAKNKNKNKNGKKGKGGGKKK